MYGLPHTIPFVLETYRHETVEGDRGMKDELECELCRHTSRTRQALANHTFDSHNIAEMKQLLLEELGFRFLRKHLDGVRIDKYTTVYVFLNALKERSYPPPYGHMPNDRFTVHWVFRKILSKC